MTRVWFDPGAQVIMIDGISPKPPLTLTVAWDGYLIRAAELTGRGIFAVAPADLGDERGNTFVDGDAAMAYLTDVVTRHAKVDAGEI